MANRATTSGYSGFAGYDGFNTASSTLAFLAVSAVSIICAMVWYGAGLGVLLIAGRSSWTYSPMFLLSAIALALLVLLLNDVSVQATGGAFLGLLASVAGITLTGHCLPRYTAGLALAVAVANAFAVYYIGAAAGAPYRIAGTILLCGPIILILRCK